MSSKPASLSDDKTLVRRQYIEDVSIFEAGDVAEEAFLIEEGEIRIFKEEDGIKHEIAVLGEGEIFGEMALIKNTSHTANAVATKRAVLIIITQKALKEKLEEADPLIAALIHMFVKRIYKSNENNKD